MRHLKILNLSCNCLQNANGIEYLYNLEELNLSHNKIINLDVFGIVNKLIEINLNLFILFYIICLK